MGGIGQVRSLRTTIQPFSGRALSVRGGTCLFCRVGSLFCMFCRCRLFLEASRLFCSFCSVCSVVFPQSAYFDIFKFIDFYGVCGVFVLLIYKLFFWLFSYINFSVEVRVQVESYYVFRLGKV